MKHGRGAQKNRALNTSYTDSWSLSVDNNMRFRAKAFLQVIVLKIKQKIREYISFLQEIHTWWATNKCYDLLGVRQCYIFTKNIQRDIHIQWEVYGIRQIADHCPYGSGIIPSGSCYCSKDIYSLQIQGIVWDVLSSKKAEHSDKWIIDLEYLNMLIRLQCSCILC